MWRGTSFWRPTALRCPEGSSGCRQDRYRHQFANPIDYGELKLDGEPRAVVDVYEESTMDL